MHGSTPAKISIKYSMGIRNEPSPSERMPSPIPSKAKSEKFNWIHFFLMLMDSVIAQIRGRREAL